VDGYSYEFLLLLVEAVLQNKKLEAIDRAMSTMVAVSHSLDLSFGGKGEIFETWKRGLLGELPVATSFTSKPTKPKKQLMSQRFESFLFSMPRKDS
jgi:hypothetical protein